MYNAIIENDLKTVKQLLKNGKDPDEYYNSNPILLYAARLGHLKICRELLNKGANIVIFDGYNDMNILHVAIFNNQPNICKLFCKRNKKCLFNSLHYAIENSENIEIIKLLVQCNANINEYDDIMCFPLEICIDCIKELGVICNECEEYYTNVYKLLIRHGANVNIIRKNCILNLNNNYNATSFNILFFVKAL